MRRTVLIVEDHSDTRALYALSLSLQEFDVVEAADGAAALTWLTDHLPDVIVTDLAMPRLDGIELCRRIRETPHGGSVPILALTGQSSERVRREVAAAGACAMCEKPLTPEGLGVVVAALLASGSACSRCWQTNQPFRWVQINGVSGLMRHQPVQPD